MTSLSEKSINNSLTRANKKEIVCWGMPDYTAGVEKTFGTTYTAETNGFIKIFTPTFNQSIDLYITIDEIQMKSCWGANNNRINSNFCIIPVKMGSTYSATCQSSQTGNSITFFPAIGG